tara:strand:- start:1573 stop:2034 length:462 start_codon:yes stop_codon:yes gene_type:complete
MKKVFLILLFIPLVNFSQTYEDLTRIDSSESFIKIMTNNGWKKRTQQFKLDKRYMIYYGLNFSGEGKNLKSEAEAGYHTKYNFFTLSFFFVNNTQKNNFNRIFKKIKKKCKYVGIYGPDTGFSAVEYKCKRHSYVISDSNFEGVIMQRYAGNN